MPDTQNLPTLLQLITALTFIPGVMFALAAWYAFRQSRQAAFWVLRRQAGQRGFRYSVLAGMLMATGALFCLVTATVTVLNDSDTPAPAGGASPVPFFTMEPETAIALETEISPELPPSILTLPSPLEMTPTPTITPTPTLTLTPSVTPTSTIVVRTPPLPETTVQAHASSHVEIVALNNNPDSRRDNTRVFETGFTRLYIFITYRNLPQGMLFQKQLFYEGTLIRQQASLWGITAERGDTVFFFGDDRSFAPGDYEVRLISGQDTLMANAEFTVTESESGQ